jgi:hypothetical protein
MKRFLFLLIAISAVSYGVSFSRLIHPGDTHTNGIGTPTVTATPPPVFTSSPTPIIEITPTPSLLTTPSGIITPKLEAFIRAPSGIVPIPYVILSGYQSFPADSGPVSISGFVQDKSFFCPTSPCGLQFPTTAQITFHARNNNGDTSSEIQANILVTKMADGYSVSIITLGRFVVFSDSCANIWQNAEPSPPSWARFPQDPADLDTEKSLHYLAGRLLTTGVVNANDCPGGGWDNNAPNACGLARVKDQMTSWQNQYDLNIWLAGRDQHIPPVILKTLLEIESQFWPTSQRLFLDELGLGQINQLGIDVLLRTNPGLYFEVCTSALFRCDQPYESLSPIDRALIRGTLVQSLDAACPTCLYGVNLNKATQSIPLIAKVLYANCVQADAILKLHEVTANYEDSWKFTLVSYHSGFGCLQSAIEKSSAEAGTQIDWKTVSANMECQGAVDYIDKFWASLLTFNNYLKKQEVLANIQLQNPGPVATPTLILSNARILVKIFVDKNGDGIQQPDETLDNVQVNLDLENGVTLTQVSTNGIAVFDMSRISVGVRGKISLPGLYRSASIQVPASGEIPIIFIFTKPILPTQLP